MTTSLSPAPFIEDLFHRGHPLTYVVDAGDGRWTSEDVMVVLRDRQWDLDPSGRLPRSKRVTTPQGLRCLPESSMKAPATSAAPAAPRVRKPAAVLDVDLPDEIVLTPDRAADDVDQPAEPAPPIVFHNDGEALPTASSTYVTVLQARDLGVDHSYQRPLDEPRVKRMVAAWDPRMVGVIDVSDRGEEAAEDGGKRYAVINGQHRAAAAARVSPAGADVWLPCNVHEGLTVAQEAALMHELDRTTKKLSGWDKWKARRGAGDPTVLTVDRIAAQHGLRVDDALTDGAMRSYGTAEKLIQLGGEELLDSALAVLKAAYGDAAAAFQAPLLMGVGQLLHRHANLDVDRLRAALAKTRPEQLRASATALRDFEDGPLHVLMAMAIATAYNRTPGAGPRISGGR